MATATREISGSNTGSLGVTVVQRDNATAVPTLAIYAQVGAGQWSLLFYGALAAPASGSGRGTRAVKVADWPGATTYRAIVTTGDSDPLDVVLSYGRLDGVEAGAFTPGPSGSTPSGGGGGPSSTAWVDGATGNDLTGTVGDSSKPFRTIQAAMTAACHFNNHGTVNIAAGSYTEAVVINAASGATPCVNVTLIANGNVDWLSPGSANLTVYASDINGVLGLQGLRILGPFKFIRSDGDTAVLIQGYPVSSPGQSSCTTLNPLVIQGATFQSCRWSVRYLGRVEMDVLDQSSSLDNLLDTCNGGFIAGTVRGVLHVHNAATHFAEGRSAIFYQSKMAGVTVRGQPYIVSLPGWFNAGDFVSDGSLTTYVGFSAYYAPRFDLSGRTDRVNLVFPADDSFAVSSLVCPDLSIGLSFLVSKASGPASNFDLRGCHFLATCTSVGVGFRCNGNLRGSGVDPTTISTASDGTVEVDSFAFTAGLLNTPSTSPFPFHLKAGATYQITVQAPTLITVGAADGFGVELTSSVSTGNFPARCTLD